ncbi:unnamed protein product [Cladocopium goreaui]|uniref:Uncharacterized protein n=1 Tax=Cladocopium goreaui TaxID=2562237 RepID=A0A9P1FU11_9DINO|nr:unnamed protein product [Cladocopium goreaui]
MFKVGFTHNPVWRWGSPIYGYTSKATKEKYSNMSVIYAAPEPYSPAMLEAALIDKYKSTVGCKNEKSGGDTCKWEGQTSGFVRDVGREAAARFLLAAVPKVLYSWDNDEVWQDLMQLATDEANFMFYEGVLDGTCRRGKFNMALLFISGDWPWLADSGNLARSYRNVQKKKNQQRHLGICHMCAAGQTGYDFEEINSRQPQWLRTMFTLDCFSEGGPPPFADLPHVPGRLAELWRFDAFHTLHLGVCKIFLSSSLALLSELQPESAIDDRFASLSALYLSWCKTHSERPWVSKLTKELLNWPSTTVFPTGSWHKGALSTTLMRWFQFRFEREGSNWPPMLARAGEACVLMNDFLKGLYDAEAWLPASTAQKIAENGFAFLIQYARLARMAYLEGRTSVTLPLSGFTDYWDDATGEAIKTCQENKIYCPDEKTLKDMRTMGFWAEGVAGKVHLEIKSVTATDCNAMVV